MNWFKKSGWLVALVCVFAVGVTTGLAMAAEKDAQESKESAEQPKADPFAVPDGTPAELLAYLEGLKTQRPTKTTKDAVTEFLEKRSVALLTVADKILAAKPTMEQAAEAVQAKLVALGDMQRMGKEGADAKIEAFPAELEKAGFKELSGEVRGTVLQIRLQGARQMSKDDVGKLLKEITAYVAASEPNGAMIGLMQNAGMLAERKLGTEAGVETYTAFSKILTKSPDKEIAAVGERLEGAARRLGLVGKAMVLEGKTIDGKPFDWTKYKGKVVLVDFFATWCGPCRAEMPNIVKNYDAFKQRGFDVVTISLDDDKAALEKFLEENKHDWTVLHESREADPKAKVMSAYYGVFGIPQMILVGADGKVVSTSVRGPQLGEQLEKLLGPAEPEKKTEEKPKAGG